MNWIDERGRFAEFDWYTLERIQGLPGVGRRFEGGRSSRDQRPTRALRPRPRDTEIGQTSSYD
jgi:hypothetical protein